MNYQTKLRRILAVNKISQENLAKLIGTTFVTLNSWVNGKSKPTRGELKNKIDELYIKYFGDTSLTIPNLVNKKKEAIKNKCTARQIIANRKLLDKITLNLTYHTNTIEGSTMTISDVREVIFDNKILSNRTAIEQREAVNHQAALNFLLDKLAHDKKLNWTPDFIQAIHLRMMTSIISNAGLWRNHGVRISSSRTVLANFIKIPDLMKKLCKKLNKETDDPVNLLAQTHAQFEQIHPFSDGNGRTGRLIMFAKSLELGVFPPIIEHERKTAYYKYLELAQTQEKHDLLENLICDSILSAVKLKEKH
ncbi:MAG: Fic family protein [Bifidobacteriaceae bacterium]|jgi:Fic family protein/DNA-binding XRE family transcriptional regulator|nr:Fic family protein [Bifidobacteriaceae bacterium]